MLNVDLPQGSLAHVGWSSFPRTYHCVHALETASSALCPASGLRRLATRVVTRQNGGATSPCLLRGPHWRITGSRVTVADPARTKCVSAAARSAVSVVAEPLGNDSPDAAIIAERTYTATNTDLGIVGCGTVHVSYRICRGSAPFLSAAKLETHQNMTSRCYTAHPVQRRKRH